MVSKADRSGGHRVAAHAYPWDVVGDPSFPARVTDLGIREVTLAAAYHSVRAATPLHPRHRLVDARHAALYRPLRTDPWRGNRLVPATAAWVAGEDPFSDAAAALRAAGVRINAWIVLTHATRLGTAHPDLAVRNCFGDRYPYALCPAQPAVRRYAATLAAEAVRDVPVDGVSLEACGQLGVGHGGHHEKTDSAFPPAAARLLSVCCCGACQAVWASHDIPPDRVVADLRDAVAAAQALDGDVAAHTLLGSELADVILHSRHTATDALRAMVVAAVRDVAPGARITLHGSPDPWATGASPGLTPHAGDDTDAVLIPAWQVGATTIGQISSARAALPERVAVGAYVTVLPPADPAAVDEHVAALTAAGAEEIHLYHLGLANTARLAALSRLARRPPDHRPPPA